VAVPRGAYVEGGLAQLPGKEDGAGKDLGMSLPGGLRGHPAGSVLLLDTWEFGWALLAPASSEIAIATKILMMAILAPTTKENSAPGHV
jgi:hypothetical protein